MSSFKPSTQPKAQNTTAKTDQGHYFSVVPTPNPREMAFVVRETAQTFNPSEVPEVGTAYKDSSFLSVKPRIQLQGFQDYVLLNFGKDGDSLWFKYGKNKVVTDQATKFRTYFTTQRFTWPAVLEDLYVVQTSQFQQAVYNGSTTQTQPSYFPRYTFRPAVSVSTVVMIEQFLSPAAWAKADVTHRQPIPTGVHASWVGLEFDFQECLHPDIVIPEKVPGAKIVSGVGVLASPTARNLQRKFIPQTNFLDWAPFFYDDAVQPTDGFWLRERVTYFPPIRPPDVFV
jgi:hypothetical protein